MVKTNLTNQLVRSTPAEEQKLYDRLIACAQTEYPAAAMNTFRNLFIEGGRSPDAEIREALENIIKTKDIEKDFPHILNRCCHILINRWQMHPEWQKSIPELVDLLAEINQPRAVSNRSARKLRVLTQNFLKTEQYRTLQRLAQVICQHQKEKAEMANSIGKLINRYPYLYDYCLISDDSNEENRQMVNRLKVQRQRQFEVDLSHYVTYQVRLAWMARQQRKSQIVVPKSVKKVQNPTLLGDRELGAGLKRYVGKVAGDCTYKELSHNFINHTSQLQSYKGFKHDLYEYLKCGIDLNYGNNQFQKQLEQKIHNILPEANQKKPDEFLLMRTSTQLLNYLVVGGSDNLQHYVFADLITNIGASATVGLLIKILLICHKVKPFLEKKLSILFNHYESFTRDGVPWLVRVMEFLNVAFSIYFGKADVSCLRQLI